jgi:hypothetical protein
MLLKSITNKTRRLVCEEPGWELIGGDYRAVESCYLAAIAGETWKCEGWAKAFRSGDPADDIYTQIGAWFGEGRDSGKVYELALGFGGGKGSVRKRNPDLPLSDEELDQRVRIYRERHPRTQAFRYGLEEAAIMALRAPDVPREFMRHRLFCRKIGPLNFLCIELPSGRAIHYPDAHLVPYEFKGRHYQAVAFAENSQGQWRPYIGPTGKPYAWNGLFVENVVQGGCRDLMAAAFVRLAEAGYQPVLTVHDEVVCRARRGEGSLQEFEYLLTLLPEWAKAIGMPLAAKVWRRPRWAENDDAPVVHVPGAVVTPDMLVKPQRIAVPDHLRPPKPAKPKIAKPKAVQPDRPGGDRVERTKPQKGGIRHPDGTLLPPGMTVEQYDARIAQLRQEKIAEVARLEARGDVPPRMLNLMRRLAGLPVRDAELPSSSSVSSESASTPEPASPSSSPSLPPSETPLKDEIADAAPVEPACPEAEPKQPPPHPQTHQIDFGSVSLPEALRPLTLQPRWMCWRWEWRKNKWTKPPLQPGNGRYARNNDPSTWGTYAEAVKRVLEGGADGIGYCLLGVEIGAVDLDHCRDRETGAIAEWAQAIVDRAPGSYCEITVSGSGLRLIGTAQGFELQRKFPALEGGQFELYRRTARYITVSGQAIGGANGPLPGLDNLLDELLAEAGQRIADDQEPPTSPPHGGQWVRGGMTEALFAAIIDGTPGGRGARFMGAVAQMKRLGWTIDGIIELFEQHPTGIAEKYAGRLRAEVERAFRKVAVDGVRLGDFYAYMPQHNYFYAPARRLWPAGSINSRLSAQVLLDDDGNLRRNEKDKVIKIAAAQWLDQNRPVEEMTWAPGDPMLVHDRLMVENMGWVDKPGTTTFNLYHPPIIQAGDPRQALPWLRLVYRLFGRCAKHIILWLAHRAQRPHEKINHGLLLGGAPGIGKDTVLAPVRLAVGEWNFQEASPKDMLGGFSPYNRAVILRINETRDLGEMTQFAFYDRMKNYLAAPPPTLPTNEKYIKHYHVPNVCGVIFTTNYKENGMYLPPYDRRHFVAWSERTSADFPAGFWQEFWDWYDDGGLWHVVAYLRQRDIAGFRPGEAPPKTEAFWDIANANLAAEETDLADALDRMQRPIAVTVEQILAQLNLSVELSNWLCERKNRRIIPKHFRACGYSTVRNPDHEQKLWVIGGKRQAVYAQRDLPEGQRIAAARRLMQK